MRDAIAQASEHGLKPELFLKGGEDGPALVEAGLKYASALANGYSDPTKLHEVYTIPRPKTDVRAGLQQAIQNGNVGEWLASLAPQTDEYRALSRAFVQYAKLAGQSNQQPIATDKPIKPGASDPRIPAIVAVLRSGGYVPEAQQGAAQPTRYTPALVAAVKQFQSDSGTKPDGILGPETLDALSTGPAERARQLAVAMERLRWLERDPPKTRIDVNTAASFFDYWRDGQHVDHRKVINGEADKPTPQLQAPIVRLVAKPTWTVPKGIGEKELATKSQAWLSDNDFVMKDGQYVQQSGDKNSLGLVKFDMDDKEAIYLHDTPAKAMFAMADRHRSHGCVRVENAIQFATALAAPGRHQRPVRQGHAAGRRNVHQAAQPDPRPPALPDRVLGRLAHPVPPGHLRLGQQYREGAGACAGPAAQDRAAREQRRHRAVDATEGAGLGRRPHPPSRGRMPRRCR